jgi:dienelactone hydrolase
VLPLFARAIDQLLTSWLAPQVRRPPGYRPPDPAPPEVPEAIAWPGPIVPQRTERTPFHGKEEVWAFQAESPVSSPWPESRTIHGRVMGRPDARNAVVVLHGAYSEYTPCQMVGQSFTQHGFRVLIPAAPCHLERTPRGTPNGGAMFWSTRAFVLGTAQWLAEVRGLVDGLRQEGVEHVGILGYSFGSQAAGLAATLWPDLDFGCLIAPVGHHHQSIVRSPAAGRIWSWMRRLPPEEVSLLDRWAPQSRRPLLDRLLFLLSRFDDLQPLKLQQEWWRAWSQPPYKEYRYGHISLYFAPVLYRELGEYAASRIRPFPAVEAATPGRASKETE